MAYCTHDGSRGQRSVARWRRRRQSSHSIARGNNSPRVGIGPAAREDPGSQLDVLPTIHHFLGIPVPVHVDGQVFGFLDYTRTPPPPPPVCVPNPATCGCLDNQQREYRSKLSKTESGRICQAWQDQFPHRHSQDSPDAWLESNYCRNPDGERRAWCYTTDAKRRWEFCNVPECDFESPLTTMSIEHFPVSPKQQLESFSSAAATLSSRLLQTVLVGCASAYRMIS